MSEIAQEVNLDEQKVTTEELSRLKEIQEKTRNLAFELGEIEMIRIQLETRRENAISLLDEVKTSETEFTSEIVEKYGKISLNPETGEFAKMD